MFKLSISLFIYTLNLKSEFSNVFAFTPYPSEPNNKTFLPFQLFFVKSFFALTSNALTQNSLVLRNLRAVFKFETLKIFRYSAPPLALL